MRSLQDAPHHLVGDVKIDFTQNASYAANGSMIDTTIGIYYLRITSRDSVRISCLVAALSDLDMFT